MTAPKSAMFKFATPQFAQSKLESLGLTGPSAEATKYIVERPRLHQAEMRARALGVSQHIATSQRNAAILASYESRGAADEAGKMPSNAGQVMAENPADPWLLGNVGPNRPTPPVIIATDLANQNAAQAWRIEYLARQNRPATSDISNVDSRQQPVKRH